jgi:recombination protein RecR
MASETQDLLARLVEHLKRLPGIGQKTAQRLAFHILRSGRDEILELAAVLTTVKERLRFCSSCNNITESERCAICEDPRRDRSHILVVEEPSTLYTLERTGEYRGLYHVLLGSLAPLEGRGPADLRTQGLLDRLSAGGVREVIIATNPTIEGEATAIYLVRLVRPFNVPVRRIAYGIPVGVDLEYADEVTLIKSLEGRRELS